MNRNQTVRDSHESLAALSEYPQAAGFRPRSIQSSDILTSNNDTRKFAKDQQRSGSAKSLGA